MSLAPRNQRSHWFASCLIRLCVCSFGLPGLPGMVHTSWIFSMVDPDGRAGAGLSQMGGAAAAAPTPGMAASKSAAAAAAAASVRPGSAAAASPLAAAAAAASAAGPSGAAASS